MYHNVTSINCLKSLKNLIIMYTLPWPFQCSPRGSFLVIIVFAHDVWRWDDDHKLQPTQRHWGTRTKTEPKPREEVLLGESGPEGVDVCQCVWGPSYTWGHSVEGQRASRPVHIHSYSGGARGGERDECFNTVVPGRVTTISTIKTPGLVVPSKPAVTTPSSPCDSSVCHSYTNTSSPLHLPVAAASQTLSTQHLGPGVKSFWVVRMRLILFNLLHLPEVLRQREMSAGCVWVQCESTGIWRENKTWLGAEGRGESSVPEQDLS